MSECMHWFTRREGQESRTQPARSGALSLRKWTTALVLLTLLALSACSDAAVNGGREATSPVLAEQATTASVQDDSEVVGAGAPEAAAGAQGETPTPVRDSGADVAPSGGAPSEAPTAPLSPVLPTPTPEIVWPADEARRTAVAPQETETNGVQVLAPAPSANNAIIVDHRAVALFDQIPEEYLVAARDLRMVYSDRSVGQNISEALDCLASPSWEQSPAHCRRDYVDDQWNWTTFRAQDRTAGRVPNRVLFSPDPVRYSRANWTFDEQSGDWSQLTQDFIERVGPTYIDTKEVLSYQITYLNVAEGSDIADIGSGYFADNADSYDIHDLEAYIAQYPDKTFFHWTTSLSRAIGSQEATDFNNQMRDYVRTNGLILFDVADIESHTHLGAACYDNRDGVEYCNRAGNCENHPDDGVDIPAICQDYTTETDGGHLGSVSAGKIQIAKAFWVLMAQIAGWEPEVATLPAPVTPQPTETAHLPYGALLPRLEG